MKFTFRPEKKVNPSDLKIISSEGLKFFEKNFVFDAVSRPYGGERGIIGVGSYKNCHHLWRTLGKDTGLSHFDYQNNKIKDVLLLFLVETKHLLFRRTKFKAYLVLMEFIMGLDIILETRSWTLSKSDHGRWRRRNDRWWLSFWSICREATDFYSR